MGEIQQPKAEKIVNPRNEANDGTNISLLSIMSEPKTGLAGSSNIAAMPGGAKDREPMTISNDARANKGARDSNTDRIDTPLNDIAPTHGNINDALIDSAYHISDRHSRRLGDTRDLGIHNDLARVGDTHDLGIHDDLARVGDTRDLGIHDDLARVKNRMNPDEHAKLLKDISGLSLEPNPFINNTNQLPLPGETYKFPLEGTKITDHKTGQHYIYFHGNLLPDLKDNKLDSPSQGASEQPKDKLGQMDQKVEELERKVKDLEQKSRTSNVFERLKQIGDEGIDLNKADSPSQDATKQPEPKDKLGQIEQRMKDLEQKVKDLEQKSRTSNVFERLKQIGDEGIDLNKLDSPSQGSTKQPEPKDKLGQLEQKIKDSEQKLRKIEILEELKRIENMVRQQNHYIFLD